MAREDKQESEERNSVLSVRNQPRLLAREELVRAGQAKLGAQRKKLFFKCPIRPSPRVFWMTPL
jgi:hypothetical protein